MQPLSLSFIDLASNFILIPHPPLFASLVTFVLFLALLKFSLNHNTDKHHCGLAWLDDLHAPRGGMSPWFYPSGLACDAAYPIFARVTTSSP